VQPAFSDPLLYLLFHLVGSPLIYDWAVEFIVAFLLGVIFQYYPTRPMKSELPLGRF